MSCRRLSAAIANGRFFMGSSIRAAANTMISPFSGSPRAMRSVAGTMLNFSIGRALGTTFMLASRMRLLLRHSPASQLLTGIKVTGASE